METLHNISPAQNKSIFRHRSMLIVSGILIAILCSLISLKDAHAAERASANVDCSLSTTKLVKKELFVNAASIVKTVIDRIN